MLQTNRGIDVSRFIIMGKKQSDSFFEQDQTADIFVLKGIIRKMITDIPQVSGTKQSITNRMYKNISIGMCQATHRIWDIDSTQNELSSGCQLVNIIAETNPVVH